MEVPAAEAAAATEPLVALEVSHIPPGTTHSELASIFSQFCAIEEVVTVFKHGSSLEGSSDSGGSALVLLPPSAAARDSAEMAAEILHDYPLEGSLLGVRAGNAAEWLRSALHPQLLDSLVQLVAPQHPASEQQPQQHQQQQQQGPAGVRPASGGSGAAPGGYAPSDAGGSSSGGLSPRGNGGGGGFEFEGAVDEQEGNACVVVMNIDPSLSAREVGEQFLQFGEVEECLKPQGKRYAFVQFVEAAAAACARRQLHDTRVPKLNLFGPVQVYPRNTAAAGSSSQAAQQQGASSGRQLFVSNIGLAISRDAVGKHFQQYGFLESVRKMDHWQYAFVTYEQAEDAAFALERANGLSVPELNPQWPIKVQWSASQQPGTRKWGGDGGSTRGRRAQRGRDAVAARADGGGDDSTSAAGGNGDAGEW